MTTVRKCQWLENKTGDAGVGYFLTLELRTSSCPQDPDFLKSLEKPNIPPDLVLSKTSTVSFPYKCREYPLLYKYFPNLEQH